MTLVQKGKSRIDDSLYLSQETLYAIDKVVRKWAIEKFIKHTTNNSQFPVDISLLKEIPEQ